MFEFLSALWRTALVQDVVHVGMFIIPAGVTIQTWLKTGKSPFVWVALGFIQLETVRFQAFASLRMALAHFKRNYSRSHEEVRALALGKK